MMLDGRRLYQEEGLAGKARRCRGHGGRAGVETEEPCCFRAGLQVQRTPRSLKQEDRHTLGNWGGDGPPIDSSPADTRGHGPPRAEYGGALSHRVHKTVLYISVSFAVSYTGLLLPSF